MKHRVLVIEDSILMQRVIGDIIGACDDLEVVGYARDVAEGWAKLNKLKPDVVALDFELPGANGITLLERIMTSSPVPVLMLSAHTKPGAELTIRALSMGAVDFFTKPSGPISIDLYAYQEELANKIRTVARARLAGSASGVVRPSRPREAEIFVGIAASTGGVRALNVLLPLLPVDSGWRVFIVQHMPRFFTQSLASHLDDRSSFSVKEAADGDRVVPGTVLVAPGGSHLCVEAKGERVALSDAPPRHGVRPSADVLFESMAEAYGNRTVAIVLTGMGHDGAAGARAIKAKGGRVVVQDPNEATIGSMPQAVIDGGSADAVLALNAIAGRITELVSSV